MLPDYRCGGVRFVEEREAGWDGGRYDRYLARPEGGPHKITIVSLMPRQNYNDRLPRGAKPPGQGKFWR
jgi:hypothetical protein